MSFSSVLKTLRQSRGLSQFDLAKQLNVSQSVIANYEVGNRKPSFDMLFVLSDFFSVSIDFLVDKENSNIDSNLFKTALLISKEPNLEQAIKKTLITNKCLNCDVVHCLCDIVLRFSSSSA